jgi:hypothetical protein
MGASAAGPSVSLGYATTGGTENRQPVHLRAQFSDPVEGFTGSDLHIWGSAGGTIVAIVTGGPKDYDIAISGMTTEGGVYAQIPAGAAYNPADEPNSASNVFGGFYWWPGPLVSVTPAAGQASPTGKSPINFNVEFTDPVEGFTSQDVIISGTAGGTKTATVTGGAKTYNVAVVGMTTSGSVAIKLPTGAAYNPADEPSLESYVREVLWSPGGPAVTINQASGQTDPTGAAPIAFTVVFAAPVTGFTSGDVMISGTAGGTKTVTVTGSGATYDVAVSGMTTSGTVIAAVPQDAAQDAIARPNSASISTDNVVTWTVAGPPTAGALTLTTSAPVPPGAKDPVILWGQGFTLGVAFGDTGANRSVQLQGTRDGLAWTTISTLTTDGSGRASLLYRPVTNLFYRAVFAGASDLGASTSNDVRTVVRQLAVIRPTNRGSVRAIGRSASVTFTTTVRPARPELAPPKVTFSFYRQVSGVWQLITTRVISVDGAGKAVTAYTFATPGQWYVRSQAGPTPYNANSVPTPSERFSVS